MKKTSFVFQHCAQIKVLYWPTSHFFFKISKIVREPNSENCLDLIFAAPPCEKVIIVPDTNYITSAIRKLMLDMPGPGGFQNIGPFNKYEHNRTQSM